MAQYKNWEFDSVKKPIFNQTEIDNLQLGFPVPEMFFGHNQLSIKHPQFELLLNASEAIGMVPEATEIRVVHSKHWKDKNLEISKPYDWTYQTPYIGSCQNVFEDTETQIDLEKLMRNDPILFYDHIVLFEDELGDCGTVQMDVRIRVMPSCFLVLLRHFLRVDGVLFRIRDVRWYHEFDTAHVIREITEKKSDYDQMVRKLPFTQNGPDLSMLTDVQWVCKTIPDTRLVSLQKCKVKL
ncbi:TIP41-like family-domain-containing protein [Gorgonomyces haynaldii]|nr:TIP41-like family-domain-containing protein [Gorgonomyces haynaldii]